MRVIDLIRAVDEYAISGILYGGDAVRRTLANAVFDTINNAGHIG